MRRLRVLVPILVASFSLGFISPSHAANTAAQDARDLRSSVASLMSNYEDNYGDRLQSSERRQLSALRVQASKELTLLVTDIRRAERTQKPGDWLRAEQSYSRAAAQAESGLDQARDILEPRLSLMERLTALSDYSTSMDQFRSLGLRIQERGR